MKAFFDAVRPMFGGRLSPSQVSGLETLVAATEGMPLSHRAYLLATSLHETAATMQPITEYGGKKYFDKYDTGRLAKTLGNTPEDDGDGFKYRGRGYVQITGRANYAKAAKATGADLLKNPDGALNPQLAARILVRGCGEGWFTGKKLSDYLPGDYVNARRVVNGNDDAKLIAGYALRFETALLLVKPVSVTKPGESVTKRDKPPSLQTPKASPQALPPLRPVEPKSQGAVILAAFSALVIAVLKWLGAW